MTPLDWTVLVATLAAIVGYGILSARRRRSADDYLRGSNLHWSTIGLSVMATQASAITFLSTPGLAFEEGMRFVQFYFGLPLAMIVVAGVFVPIYYRLRVVTAYEYLEQRFDVRVRVLGSVLFLIQRGLAAGITIYAPAIILSTILGWPLHATILVIGLSVIVYTVTGGTTVVSRTQKQQMIVILCGMVAAAGFLVTRLPETLSLDAAAALAGTTGRMEVVDPGLRLDTRYTLWSGLTGGFFLALSYFGTDQSQVQRYLGGQSVGAGKLGLLFNGLFKIPMQFGILFFGVLLYVFYVFSAPPVFFNEAALGRARAAEPAAMREVEDHFAARVAARRDAAHAYVAARDTPLEAPAAQRFVEADRGVAEARAVAKKVIVTAAPGTEPQDADFVFLTFVLGELPTGLVGLLIAVVLSAAMSSIASELNALGTTSAIDLVQRLSGGTVTDASRVRLTQLLTVGWGLVALGFASTASLFDNLIEAVNVLGSLFYGTVLGLFMVAFFLRRVGATAVLWAGVLAEVTVLALFLGTDLGFLWYNVTGCAVVMAASLVLQGLGVGRTTRAGSRPA